MIRVIITQLILFLLPFIGFFVFRWATQGWMAARLAATPRVVFWLAMTGVGLVIAGFVYFAVTGRESTGVYVPTQYIDGELVPGGFRENGGDQD
jgi:hypothetical protein